MTLSTFNRIWFFAILISSGNGCYHPDLHHELPCEVTIEQPNELSKSPSTSPQGSPSLAPSIQGATSSQTNLPTAITTTISSPPPFVPPSPPPTFVQTASPSTPPPTLEPTTPPSASPTAIPVPPPTFAPTSSPTSAPTSSPTSAPTSSPTVAPTLSPTVAPTIAPTEFPTSAPTSPPSVSPTLKPTDFPSLQPSNVPTSKPTKENCKANQDGFFGGVTGNPVLVSYGYELETTPISVNTLQNEVLPALKDDFVNSLLPILFGNQCGRRLLQVVQRRLEILGISARPDDVPLSNVPCKTSLANPANNCSVVSGELTLFTDGNGTDEGSVVQSGLQAGMTSGAYVHADSHIVRVTYVNLGSYSSLNDGNTGNSNSATSSSGSNSKYLLVAIPAVAAAIVVIAAIIWRRRRRLAGDADDSTNPSASRAPRTSGGIVPGLDEMPPGLPAPMSLEEGTVYTSESNF